MSKRVNVACFECGKQFQRIPSLTIRPRHSHIFCSKTCYGKYRSRTFVGENHSQWNRITVTCRECGKTFKTKPSRLKQQKSMFCSKECAYINSAKVESVSRLGENNPAWQPKIKVACLNCGKPIYQTEHSFKQNKRSFCSNDCRFSYCVGSQSSNWRGGYKEYYGFNWQKQKRKARERDHNTCQICGKVGLKKKLDVHHKIAFKIFKTCEEANALANLLTVCHQCHMKIEYPNKILHMVNI